MMKRIENIDELIINLENNEVIEITKLLSIPVSDSSNIKQIKKNYSEYVNCINLNIKL